MREEERGGRSTGLRAEGPPETMRSQSVISSTHTVQEGKGDAKRVRWRCRARRAMTFEMWAISS